MGLKAPAATLLLHATNVTGLGASQVVGSLLGPLCDRLRHPTHLHLPTTGTLGRFRTGNRHLRIYNFRRWLPRSVSRLFECLLPTLFFPRTKQSLVLGDIPLRGRPRQVVLVHQAHLVAPRVNRYVSRSLKFRIARWLFAKNLRFVSKLVVQSSVMKDELTRSYPDLRDRIVVIPQPPAAWVRKRADTIRRPAGPLSLFYPAAGYPHKNHRLLREMNCGRWNPTILKQIIVTLSPDEEGPLKNIEWAKNVGRLEPTACLEFYHQVDGLFFPSILESYPLPLVEGMTLGLPIICADRPYARWICEGEAIYFQPEDREEAWRAIAELKSRLDAGWRPDWTAALSKGPSSWDEVADSLIDLLRDA